LDAALHRVNSLASEGLPVSPTTPDLQ